MFKESVLIALKALMANKLRSILTMLGIIIGVGAVIAMISIGMGVRQQVQDSISSLGSNMLIIMPGAPSSHGVRGAAGSYTTLKKEDAKRASYYNYYTGSTWGDCADYDMIINVGRCGIDKAVELIANYVK